MSLTLEHCLVPDWPAPPTVRALSTTRLGGVSCGPYASLNLAQHCGDAVQAVAENRQRLQALLNLAAPPLWLNQVHGTRVVALEQAQGLESADASTSYSSGRACVVMTADCLPVLFCNRAGTLVAAAHAGWRGLVGGVLEATIAALPCSASELLAWLGPAIGPSAFEVGEEVRAAFIAHDPAAITSFQPSPNGRWLADLYRLARQRLAAVGVSAVYGGGRCTFSEAEYFHSYRRDGAHSGRMASLVWLV